MAPPGILPWCAASARRSRPSTRPALALGQPLPGFERNRQPGRGVRCFDRRQSAFYIAIAPGVREPDVAGAEGVAHMEKRGDFPKPAITGRASVEMLMPPGIAAQEGQGQESPGHVAGPASDSSQRGKDLFAGAGSLDLERAQHARRIASEPGPALNNMRQGIGRHRVAQLLSRSDNAFELLPAPGSRDGLFKRRAVPFCLEQRRSKGPEGGQRYRAVLSSNPECAHRCAAAHSGRSGRRSGHGSRPRHRR